MVRGVICNFNPPTKASALDCTTVWPVEPSRKMTWKDFTTVCVAAGDVGANKKYNRPRCAVCCHGLFGAEKVVEFSVGAGKAFRSEGSQPLDDNASFHGRRRLQRWVEHLVSLDMTNLGKKSAIQSELQSNVQRHNCSHVHDQPLAGTLASCIIHHFTCLRDSTA